MPRFISVAAKRGSLGNPLLPDAPGSSRPILRQEVKESVTTADRLLLGARRSIARRTGAARGAAMAATSDMVI